MDAHASHEETVADDRQDLVGLSRAELTDVLVNLGEKPFRAKQLWHWIYNRGFTDFEAMTDIGKGLRAKLTESYRIGRPGVATEQLSSDRTRKWLMRFDDGKEAECVFIPEEDRGALCISSQVGCTLTCKFCHTGTQTLVRNLTAPEIVGQLMLARDSYGEWPSTQDERLLSNIVMMGMGEPLFNYDNVAKALTIIMDGEGIALSKRRITLSTAGVVPMIRRCGAELGVNLAISLHAVTDELRDHLIPLNKKYPLKELLQACREYPGANNARRITFEYVMLQGVNDSDDDARRLVKLIEGIPAKINLIPFNEWP
ncbi:MAG: 23S rRNA (adenine(2503)-C(2))-methyltransferase RlmN, partial [Rhodospirillales bacterium]